MKTKTLSTGLKLGVVACGLALTAQANAASFVWDFQNTAGLPTQSFVETSVAGGQTITMRAYTTTGSTSTWTTANFTNQGSSGLGIQHTGEPTGAPQHAIDSITNQDIVVVDAGVGNTIDWTMLRIGYGVDNNTSTGALIANDQADIRLWTGNTLNAATATINGLGSASILENLAINTNGNINNPSGVNLSPSRYLIISGNINDAFKLQKLGGDTTSPPNQTPEPASMALLGLGLLGLGYARRRKA